MPVARFLDRIHEVLLAPAAFRVFSAVFLLYAVVGFAFLLSWNNADLWLHMASIGAFAADPFHPAHPSIVADAPSHLHTPFHLLWGLIARVTGLPPFFVMGLIALGNAVLFLVACRVLAARIVGDRRYALVLATVLLFFWIEPWQWAGFYQFGLLPLTLTYSYWFSFPAALILLAYYDDRRGALFLAGAAFAIAFIILSHPVTGSFLVIALALRVLTLAGVSPGRRLAMLVPPVAALALATLWPMYHFLGDVVAARTAQDTAAWRALAGDYRRFWDKWPIRIGPALPGFAWLVYTARDRRIDFVAVGIAIFAAIFVANYAFLGNGVLGRYLIYLALFLHLALVLTYRRLAEGRWARVATAGYLAILAVAAPLQIRAAAAQFGISGREAPSGWRSNVEIYRHFRGYAPYIRPRDVVLAPPLESWVVPGILGAKTVVVIHPNPYIADQEERLAAGERFFADGSPEERRAIVDRWAVTRVLVPRNDAALPMGIADRLELLAADDRYVLYAVR